MLNSFNRRLRPEARRKARGATRRIGARGGFTLIELLVVVGIGTMVMALIAGAASKLRQGARGVACRSNLRGVALDFITFAEDLKQDRGERSNDLPGDSRFYLLSFADKSYRVGDFYESKVRRARLEPSMEAIMCPSGPDSLTRLGDMPCDDGGIGPGENVSLAFNARLYRQTILINGDRRVAEAVLDSRLLGHSDVPLLFDVDGAAAVKRSVKPFFSAPPIEGWDDFYWRDKRFWFPAMRHGGKMNVVFVGGHVLSSADPLHEEGWDWTYQVTAFDKPKGK